MGVGCGDFPENNKAGNAKYKSEVMWRAGKTGEEGKKKTKLASGGSIWKITQ